MKSLNCTRVGLNTMCHVISPSTRLPPRRPLSRTPHPQRGVFLPHNYLLSYFFPPHIAHDAHDDHTDDMPSSSTSTKETVTRQVPWIDHTLRQLKLLVPGAVVTYYLGTVNDFLAVLYGQGGQWGQCVIPSLPFPPGRLGEISGSIPDQLCAGLPLLPRHYWA